MKKQLSECPVIQPFPDDVIEVLQHVYIQQDKDNDQEGDEERADDCIQDKLVYLFHIEHKLKNKANANE